MKKMALAIGIVTALVIAGCGGDGSDDTGNGNDVFIYVDYGDGDDTSRPDIQIPPDLVVYDDEGNPIDLVDYDYGHLIDTVQPKDNGTVKDTANPPDTTGEDANISDFCTPPTSCAFNTINDMRDNCDGTFTDLKTGLMWQGLGEDHPLAATNSNLMSRQCNTTKTGCNNGRYYEDWRMPTIEEVRSLVRGCPATAAGGSCPASSSCRAFDECLTDQCNGCGTGGDFEYKDGEDTYYKYIDPRMKSVAYGSSYSAVMSSTSVNKTTSDARYRFFYLLNYNAKLAALNPMQQATDGVMFCVRAGN